MRVHIFGKREFDKLMIENNITDENVESRDSIFFISITDTPELLSKLGFNEDRNNHYFKEDHENVINLDFDDVENDGESSPTKKDRDTRAFSEKQAKRLYEFIKQHKDKETCIVHCMAGISRSGAVGSFVNGYAQGDWERFKRDNPWIVPNARVYRMLNEVKYNDY